MLKKYLLYFAPPVLLLLVFFAFVYRKPLYIFPNKATKAIAYSDSIEGGNTEIHFFHASDTAFNISFTLRKGFTYPYAGLAVEPETTYFPDLSGYDYIDLDISSTNSKAVQFFLNTYEPGITIKGKPMSLRYVLYETPAKNKKGKQRLRLRDFKTPIWWYPLIGLSEKDLGEPHLDKVVKFSFSNGVLLPLNEKETITIRSITVGKNYYPFYGWASGTLLIYYSLMALIVYYKKRLSSIPSKVISYQQIELETGIGDAQKKIIEYLSTRYNDPELSLSAMALELGLNQRKISDEIKTYYSLTFKQYVNGIRLNEAKRLLKETALPINEIAYKVGFNNVTHFNRAFKQYCNCSPQEYRSLQ